MFNDALLKLADSYNKNGMPTKTISLFNKINKDDVGSLPYYLLMSYTGDAYKDLKEYNGLTLEYVGYDDVDSYIQKIIHKRKVNNENI